MKDVASEEDAISVMTDELALDVFNQCGITAVLDVSPTFHIMHLLD